MQADRARLQDLLIVSQANTVGEDSGTPGSTYEAAQLNCQITVSHADGAKCERCWKYDPWVGTDASHPTVCERCAKVLNAGAAA
jgi:isoleucyl-tRNA synthetase